MGATKSIQFAVPMALALVVLLGLLSGLFHCLKRKWARRAQRLDNGGYRDEEKANPSTDAPVRDLGISWPLPVHVVPGAQEAASSTPPKPTVRLNALPEVPESNLREAWEDAASPIFVVGDDEVEPAAVIQHEAPVSTRNNADQYQRPEPMRYQRPNPIRARGLRPTAMKIRFPIKPMIIHLPGASMLMPEGVDIVDRSRFHAEAVAGSGKQSGGLQKMGVEAKDFALQYTVEGTDIVDQPRLHAEAITGSKMQCEGLQKMGVAAKDFALEYKRSKEQMIYGQIG